MSFSAPSRSHYLAVVTLLHQLDLKEYNWVLLSLILEGRPSSPPEKLLVLFDSMISNVEFSRIVSKFLMDRDRAGSFWVNSWRYANLAEHLLEFLRDK
jgi:hypothetical protein